MPRRQDGYDRRIRIDYERKEAFRTAFGSTSGRLWAKWVFSGITGCLFPLLCCGGVLLTAAFLPKLPSEKKGTGIEAKKVLPEGQEKRTMKPDEQLQLPKQK